MSLEIVARRPTPGRTVEVNPEGRFSYEDGLLYGVQSGDTEEFIFASQTAENGAAIPSYDGGIVVGTEPAYGGKITVYILVPKAEYQNTNTGEAYE